MFLDQFWVFFAGVLILNVTPGPDMAFTLASAVRGGARAGVAAAAGIVAGCLFWAVLAAGGLAAMLSASALALSAVRIAGGLYLLYLAWRAYATRYAFDMPDGANSLGDAFRSGLVTNLFNPKVGLFFLAFLPGFTDAASGPVWAQTLFLGAIFSVSGGVVLLFVAFGAGAMRTRLSTSRKLRAGLNLFAATAFAALGARVLLNPR